MATLDQLKSNADCILYTYGVGDSPTQAAPPYILELAEQNPTKTYDLIHCDEEFRKQCVLDEQNWQLETSENSTAIYQSQKFKNLKVRLISETFRPSVFSEFTNYLEERLEQHSEIFLAAHAMCWVDHYGCLGDAYNQLREKYAGRIHLYIQASYLPAFIYKGPYSPLLGISACDIFNNHRKIWLSFERVFSKCNPTDDDVQIVKRAFDDFLAVRSNPQHSKYNNIFENWKYLRGIGSDVPDQVLKNYVENPLENRVIVIPLEKLNAQIWNAPPGTEECPEPTDEISPYTELHRYNATCRALGPLVVAYLAVVVMVSYNYFSNDM